MRTIYKRSFKAEEGFIDVLGQITDDGRGYILLQEGDREFGVPLEEANRLSGHLSAAAAYLRREIGP